MIRLINSKDYLNFSVFCEAHKNNPELYITKDNKRISLSDPIVCRKVFNNCLRHGDKAYIYEEAGFILGMILVIGFADKFERKYLKIIGSHPTVLDGLFRYLTWNLNTESYLKVKLNSPLLKICKHLAYKQNFEKKFYFTFLGKRGYNGDEVLLKYSPNPRPLTYEFHKKDDED
jgi:hypothetical protein